MEIDYRAIGTRIRRLRKAQGLTQQTLAELSDQEPSNISHIERGATKLSLPTLVSIANALGVTADQLLCDSIAASGTVYQQELMALLAGCSHWELRLITETIRTLREGLHQMPPRE